MMWFSALVAALVLTLGCAVPVPAEAPTERCNDGSRCSESRSAHPDAAELAAPPPLSPVPVYSTDPSWGHPDAPVTILYASDFECPFCARVVPTLSQLQELYGPAKIRIVFKHHPLPFHRMARPAHLAAIIVTRLGGSDAFWRFHHEAFASDEALSPAAFERWAIAAGVDAAKFKRAYADPTVADTQVLETHLNDNSRLGINGTPAFLINGRGLTGAQPLSEFRQIVDEELAAAQSLQDSGVLASHVSAQRTALNLPGGGVEGRVPGAEVPQERDAMVWAVPVANTDPQRGAADALVTIVLFSDFECPFCQRVNPTLATLLREHGTDLRVVWKDNPLPFHPNARRAAALARFAYEKGGNPLFWAAHDLLFADQQDLGDPLFERIATQLKFSWTGAKRALDSGKYDALFAESQDLASSFDAQGTPHFFINGKRLSGAQPIEAFRALVEERLAAAHALVAAGTARAQVYGATIAAGEQAPPPEQVSLPEPSRAHPRTGARAPKIVIQAFTDYECPFCGRANSTLEQLLKADPNGTQVVWRSLPLPFHPNAQLAAEAAQEVFAQKGSQIFSRYQALLFRNQQALGRAQLEAYAAEVGINLQRFRQALDEHIHLAMIEADLKVAEVAGIQGTPTFVINGYLVSGAQPYDVFRRVIRHALRQEAPDTAR
ncbi:MAG: hypothetical protein RJA70_960 [Pseudomonadota bacterium]|jgi:protein-disulfide isomerase